MGEQDVVALSTAVARSIAAKARQYQEGDLLGAAWEGAQRAASRLDPSRTAAQQRSFIAKAAFNAVISFIRQDSLKASHRAIDRTVTLDMVDEFATTWDRYGLPPGGAPQSELEALQGLLDQARVQDPTDRRIAAWRWCGGPLPDGVSMPFARRRVRVIKSLIEAAVGA